MIDLRVQHTADAFQHLDPGVAEVRARMFGPDMIDECPNLRRSHLAEETAIMDMLMLMRRALLFVHFQPSLSSTVNILFCSDARVGMSAAIDVGNPMCRRSVPISTTSSSPFLN